ncbi:solute carrier family 2, facilitated glucose transporter member 8 [Galendromus occidentalis]|uniref:Solute carrier family 2, facilitated glucose transporter member 8 n=1 Tax=Galendromus occidentalis TaxID=34638 RepID=A0AAJ6QUA2_9ACAR|nr:solute carrier family 2, facilitated glucose transporter member 8 [Galendromus occidentalis]
MSEPDTKPHYASAVFFAYSASFAVGTAIGFAAPAQSEIEENFPNIDYSLFGSLITVGALTGSLIAGVLVERFGRVGTILFSCLFFTGGWILILLRQNVEMLYLARFLLGSSAGINCMVIPIYISEITPAERRGIYCTGHTLSIVVGILAIYVFGKKDWLRATPLAFVCFLPTLATVLTMIFIPESPAWLMKQNSPKSMVSEALYFFFGRTAFAESQRELLMESKEGDGNNFSVAYLKDPAVLRPLLIALILAGTQQACGINAILFYTNEIFSSASRSIEPSIQVIIVGAVQVVFTFVAALLIDRAGRRVLLLLSSTISLVGMLLLIAFYVLQEQKSPALDHLSWLPAISLSIFVAGFSVGLGPVPWLLMGELLPVRARGVGVGLSVGFNSLCAFLVTKFFPNLMVKWGPSRAFSILAGVIAFSFVFVYFFVPETKNKTLEEIGAMFESRSRNGSRGNNDRSPSHASSVTDVPPRPDGHSA